MNSIQEIFKIMHKKTGTNYHCPYCHDEKIALHFKNVANHNAFIDLLRKTNERDHLDRQYGTLKPMMGMFIFTILAMGILWFSTRSDVFMMSFIASTVFSLIYVSMLFIIRLRTLKNVQKTEKLLISKEIKELLDG